MTGLKRALGLVWAIVALLGTPAQAQVTDHGRLVEYDHVAAAGLPEQRLTIWLPPGYDGDTRRYPVVYMHDAQNLFDPAKSGFNKVWAADKAMLGHRARRGIGSFCRRMSIGRHPLRCVRRWMRWRVVRWCRRPISTGSRAR